jgi:hypothetical protein
MTEPADRIRAIIEREGVAPGPARHLAEAIVRGLQLRREHLEQTGDELRWRIRYRSAWFDDELTKLEGAE